jgi:hypothetical protein
VRAVPGALGVTASGPGSGAEQGVRWGGSGSGAPDTKRLTVGVEGLMRLAKAFVSSRYVAGAMRSWGDDLVRDRSSYYVMRCLMSPPHSFS